MNRTVTVAPIDNYIVVDGLVFTLEFQTKENIHAIQWDGKKKEGHVELRDYKGVIEIKSEKDFSAYVLPYINKWEDEKQRLEELAREAEEEEEEEEERAQELEEKEAEVDNVE